RPDAQARSQEQAEAIVRACRHIEQAESTPALEVLAHEAGMSRFHFHRLFKAMVGLTPRAYAQAWRSGRVRAALQDEGSVLAAVYAAGYASTGRFYADSDAVLGMTPTRFRQGGADTQIRFAIAASALGAMLVAQSARGI